MKVHNNSIKNNHQISKFNVTNNRLNISQSQPFKDQVIFQEIDFYEINKSDYIEDNLFVVARQLFSIISQKGIKVEKKNPLKFNNYILEASFQAKSQSNYYHTIYLPIKHEEKVTLTPYSDEKALSGFMNIICKNSTNNDLVKMIIITAHEYGHFLSWQNGNHNIQLKNSMQFMNTHAWINTNHSVNIYREELLAWNFGFNILSHVKFNYLNIFKKIKSRSLNSYHQLLNFSNVPLKYHILLSVIS